MVRAGVIGLGKMGISHCSIINAHPDVDFVAVCDSSKFVLSAIEKYTDFVCYADYKKMIKKSDLDCLVVATPTRLHADMVQYAMERDIHVFVEKPLSLSLEDGRRMVEIAERKKLVNQVGYHNRFIGTFKETKRLLERGAIGKVYHILGEAYGPVVLKQKGSTWRSDKSEGGGCLFDYASHVVNLIGYLVGVPDSVAGTVLRNIYSKGVDDAVYATLFYNSGITGQLSINWSDETYRKMSTQITILGKLGKIISDAQECRIYLKNKEGFEGMSSGWNIRYITDVTDPVKFNLRGEEYSAQIDYFIDCIKGNNIHNISSFLTAFETDNVIDFLRNDAENRS